MWWHKCLLDRWAGVSMLNVSGWIFVARSACALIPFGRPRFWDVSLNLLSHSVFFPIIFQHGMRPFVVFVLASTPQSAPSTR